MSFFVLDQTASQIDQAINAAYSSLVLAGTGLVRTSGDQDISGKKTFHGTVNFTGFPINLTGVSSFVPFSNTSTDVGSVGKMFRTGFFSGVTGYTGYFENLKVGNLITSLVPSLVNVTGKDMTLSGTTNIAAANITGNLGVTGNLSVIGATTLSSNVSLLGTVYATGNKTFSGVFNQSGDVNIYGKTLVSGNSSFTGNVNVTGNLSVVGNQNITGKFTHTGEHFIDSNNTSFTFTGGGANHAFKIFAPTLLSGTVYHTGNFFRNGDSDSTGNITNKGDFSNTGSFNLWGSLLINTGTSVIFNANPQFNSGVSVSGNLITPSLKINPNLVSTPSGGAIEYSRGQFFATNELTGAPTRALINQTYSYVAPNNFVFNFTTGAAGCLFLGGTGIYLSTGIYKIETSLVISKGTTIPAASFGISGSSTHKFNYRCGRASIQDSNDANPLKTVLITGNSSVDMFSGAFAAPNMPASYALESVITITGHNHKIFPFLHSSTNSATGSTTGINFYMLVTQLNTGTGINNASFNGPWSAL